MFRCKFFGSLKLNLSNIISNFSTVWGIKFGAPFFLPPKNFCGPFARCQIRFPILYLICCITLFRELGQILLKVGKIVAKIFFFKLLIHKKISGPYITNFPIFLKPQKKVWYEFFNTYFHHYYFCTKVHFTRKFLQNEKQPLKLGCYGHTSLKR